MQDSLRVQQFPCSSNTLHRDDIHYKQYHIFVIISSLKMLKIHLYFNCSTIEFFIYCSTHYTYIFTKHIVTSIQFPFEDIPRKLMSNEYRVTELIWRTPIFRWRAATVTRWCRPCSLLCAGTPAKQLSHAHGLINYKDTKTKCRLYWCLVKLIDWRYSQSCWYFRPSFVNYTLSLVNLPHPSPPSLPFKVHVQTVCGWEGVGGVELCLRPYSTGY